MTEFGRPGPVGHAERRRLYGEGDTLVAAKTAAALRNGLTPVLCVGERDRADPEEAARRAGAEAGRLPHGLDGTVVLAHDPRAVAALLDECADRALSVP
ncbi:triose-phosphate isomerase [Streptomyces sp. CRN 30]|uniref:triose-phosphate isomerase n=1 Tax=Streptomyces sp. CRN 30 TaxID=3075613 RepID=UPI0039C320AA